MSKELVGYLEIIVSAWDRSKERGVPLEMGDCFIDSIRAALKRQDSLTTEMTDLIEDLANGLCEADIPVHWEHLQTVANKLKSP